MTPTRPRPCATYDYRPASTALVERAHHIARVCQQFGVADAVRRRAKPVPDGIWAVLRKQDLLTE